MPFKRKGEQKWTGTVVVRGKKVSRRLGTRQEAATWEVDTRREMSSGSLPKTDTVYSIAEWGNDYLDYAEKFCTKTYKEKKMVMQEFNATIEDLTAPAKSITPKVALDYLSTELFKKIGGNAVNKRRKNLAAGWNWGVKYHDLPNPNPFLMIEKYPEEPSPRYVVPERDFWKVYELAKGRDKTMLLAYLHLGARRSEIFKLRWDDVDLAENRVRLWTRKRKDGSLEADWLPMTDELHTELVRLKAESQSQWVFPSNKAPDGEDPFTDRKRWLLSLCTAAKVRSFGFHCIRHLTASILAQAGVPAITIQAILRHHNLATTERYLHQLSEVRPAFKVFDGRGVKSASMENSCETVVKLVK